MLKGSSKIYIESDQTYVETPSFGNQISENS